MKTFRLFSMAALALMMAACSSNDDELTVQLAQQDGKIPFSATIATPSSGATTRTTYTESGTSINVAWKKNDMIALVHNGTRDIVSVETVNSDGSATITGSITVGVDDEDVVLVYPANLVAETTGGTAYTENAYVTNKIMTQDGTLTYIQNNLDIRKGTGKLAVSGASASLKANVSMDSQIAIFKFTTKNASSVNIDVTSLTASIDGENYVITPASATSTFYAALPAVSGKKVSFMATGSPNNYRFAKDGVTFDAGKYYQSALAMTEATTFNLGSIAGDITAENGDVLTGTLGGNYKISIADGAIVMLDGVNINGVNNSSYAWAGLTPLGDATIILKDGSTNTVKGFHENHPGIFAAVGKTLTIKGETAGTGTLTASSNGYGAGIGGGYYIDCGNIEIQGGTIIATGGDSAAGIGGGHSGECGDITISGGTITATGGDGAAGIGSGRTGTCGDITISGGTVTATGGNNGAGIGSGGLGTCSTITIESTVTQVTATKGDDAPNSIGAGDGSTSCGTVTIGGTVYWDGTAYQNDGGTYLKTSPLIYIAP